MARVFGIGETVLDIVFKDDKPVSAIPGGSVLNSLVSLGRLGVDVSFISEYGNDQAGKLIDDFLEQNQVQTSLVRRQDDLKTSLALAFLDEKNDASYSFYKDPRDEEPEGIRVDFEDGDIFLFGSFYAIGASNRNSLLKLLEDADLARCSIIYDPNFRVAHLDELEKVRPFILENISYADIVRGSDEDFNLIFGANSAADAWEAVNEAGCPNLIYTSNKNQVALLTPKHKAWLDVPDIKPVSTIGAGDNFNAGIIWTLVREELTKRDLHNMPAGVWERMGMSGIAFSIEVCQRTENYISVEFAVEMLRE